MAPRLVTAEDIPAARVTSMCGVWTRSTSNHHLLTVQLPGQVVQFLARRRFC
jgi:hypothetical protein